MSSYSGGFGSGGVDYGAKQEKGRVMEQVRSQIAVANLQEMIIVGVSRPFPASRACFPSENVRQVFQEVCRVSQY